MVFAYMQVPTLLGIGRITVTLELPATGGLYRFSNVTYRGVQIGKVTDGRARSRNGVKATLSLDTSPKIPADLQAEVHSVSAVGEQYVDLRPRTKSPPYLHDGSVIAMQRHHDSATGRPDARPAQRADQQHPQRQAQRAARRVVQGASTGRATTCRRCSTRRRRSAADLNGVADHTSTLFEDTGPLLDSQAETTDAIRLWTRSLAGVTDQLVTNDPQVRTLLRERARRGRRGLPAARPGQAHAAGAARQPHHHRHRSA